MAKHENITRAAEELHITQPNLSRSIARLEEEVGCALFDRSRGKLRLNNEGGLLCASIEKAFNELDNGLRMVRESGRSKTATLTIVSNVMNIYTNTSEHYFMGKDELYLTQVLCQMNEIPELLKSKKADLGISFNTFSDQNLEYVELAEMEIHLIVGINSRHFKETDITLGDLRDDYFVCNEMGYSSYLTDALCVKSGFVPKKKYISADFDAVGRILEEYDVVSLIPVDNSLGPKLNDSDLTRIVKLDNGRHKETLKLYYNRGTSICADAEGLVARLKAAVSGA